MNDILLIFSNNTDTRSKIQTIAKEEQIDCFFLSYGDHVADMAKRLNPFLLIIDFTSQGSDWSVKHLGEVKERRPRLQIVGIVGSEVGEGDIARYERAGCDHILNKRSFLKKLPSILQVRI